MKTNIAEINNIYDYAVVYKALSMVLVVILMYLVLEKAINVSLYTRGIRIHKNKIRKFNRNSSKQVKNINLLNRITKVMEKTPFKFNTDLSNKVRRANIKIYGKEISGEEYNAISNSLVLIPMLLGVVTMAKSFSIGLGVVISSLIVGNAIKGIVLDVRVSHVTAEIESGFSDMYLSIHFSIKDGTEPIEESLKAYLEGETKDRMREFIGKLLYYLETFGEYEGALRVAHEYRDMPKIAKMARLIRQSNEKADINMELEGFKESIITDKRNEAQKRADVIIMKAKASFNILLIILLQAILSAMAVYAKDLGMMKSLLG